jgi:hypothetical protein
VAENLTIESPDFDRIKKLDGNAIRDAITLLWYVANNESAVRSQTVQRAQNRISPKVLSAAPAAQQDNYDPADCGYLLFTGGTAFNLTGIRNGIDGRTLLLENLGTGTITLKFESASSDAANRFYTVTGGDKTVTTGQTAFLQYLNSRWRVASFI